jgi:hypothetical protein
MSPHHAGRAYRFGGGLYIDPVFPPYRVRVLVGGRLLDAEPPPAEAIDYYARHWPG